MTVKQFSTKLLRSDSKTEIFVPPDVDIQISLNEYYDALKAQAVSNKLPAVVEQADVYWDKYDEPQKRILLYHENQSLRTLQFVVGLDNMGNFYYVEERLCYDLPHELPPRPKERILDEPENPKSGKAILKHIGSWVVVTIFTVTIGMWFYPLYWLWDFVTKSKEYPYKMEQLTLTRNFDRAIAKWINHIVETDKRSRADDELGRFFSALRSTIQQVNHKLFLEKHAEMKDRKEKELTEKALNDELEKRRTEGF